MQRENRETRGKARSSGESREAERRREISSEYDRYRAAYASRARFHQIISIYTNDQIVTMTFCVFDEIQMANMKHIKSSLCVSNYLFHNVLHFLHFYCIFQTRSKLLLMMSSTDKS